MNLRLVVTCLVAAAAMAVVEASLDINPATLGGWYVPYVIVSTVIVIALIVRATMPRTPPPRH